eukprot:TRINITY_DN22863_c0_g1_i3.p1 TRINITY_DN22863_c0_g1~~TRINITY_DN22863_c0_g1_i3.p1  ORF type:complete len:137 (-),score=0.63 TRINITY_DN22863_c0_g1_i3:119-529(-)
MELEMEDENEDKARETTSEAGEAGAKTLRHHKSARSVNAMSNRAKQAANNLPICLRKKRRFSGNFSMRETNIFSLKHTKSVREISIVKNNNKYLQFRRTRNVGLGNFQQRKNRQKYLDAGHFIAAGVLQMECRDSR